MVSALNNLMSRINADAAMLTEKDLSLIASSVDVGATGDTFRFAPLIEAATTAAAIEFIDGRPFQLVVVPLRAPVPVAWIVLGFVLDDGLARQLQSLTRAEVSLLDKEGDRWVSYGSTLAAPLRADLTVQLAQAPWNYDEAFDLDLAGDAYLTRIAGLGGQGAATLAVVLELGGEERTVTVLTEMSDVIEANDGVVDKYIGDAVMALFGAPVAQPDAAACAIRAALGIDAALEALNGRLASRGQRQLDFGVGINTAEVVAGNMGSARRLNYTVIGDGVNVASRVEGLTRVYGVHVIVTESVRAGAGGFVYRELDRVQVKGRATPLRIFEPLGETGALPDESLARLERWHEALTHYRDRDWEDAADLLAGLLKGEPGSPLYELYRVRIAHLRQTPPGPGWNGVYVFREK